MNREMLCVTGELVGELVVGNAIGIVANNVILPKCDRTVDKIGVVLGTMVVSWMIGREWAKKYYKWCDHTFHTDNAYIIDRL